MNQSWINPAAAVHRWARIAGAAPAVYDADGGVLTFAQLSQRVRQTAAVLAADGVGRGDRVAYLGMNSPLFLETLLASAHLGAVFVPMNFRLASAEVADLLTHAGCTSAVVESGHRALAESIASATPVRRFYLDGKADEPEPAALWRRLDGQEGSSSGPAGVSESETAILMYTSGTTGRPKGVILSYGNLWWNQANVHAAIDIRPRSATLAVAPLFHIGGLNAFTLGTLTRGGAVVVHRRFEPAACLRDIARLRIASTFMVPVMFAAMLRCAEFATADLSSLRAAVVAGAPVPPGLVEAYAAHGVALQQAWGLTETAPFATYLPPHLSARHPESAGFAMPYSEVRLTDPSSGLPVTEPGVPGELRVRGPNVTSGYWDDPAATSAAFDAEGWLRTGDLGVLDAAGGFQIVDRLKDLIISGGENISPAEIERVLAALPGVRDVAVAGLTHSEWGETPVAVVVVDPEVADAAALTIEQVRRFAADRLARFKLPTRLLCVDALPRNAAGKIDRAAVRALVAAAFGPAALRETVAPVAPASAPAAQVSASA